MLAGEDFVAGLNDQLIPLVVEPLATVCVVVALLLALSLAISVFRFGLSVVGLRRPVRPQRPPALPDEKLPSYSVLVPLYDEANVVPPLVRYLSRLDYPADRLEIAGCLTTCRATRTSAHAACRAVVEPCAVTCPDGGPSCATQLRDCRLTGRRAQQLCRNACRAVTASGESAWTCPRSFAR